MSIQQYFIKFGLFKVTSGNEVEFHPVIPQTKVTPDMQLGYGVSVFGFSTFEQCFQTLEEAIAYCREDFKENKEFKIIDEDAQLLISINE
jgi:hypothetical protein